MCLFEKTTFALQKSAERGEQLVSFGSLKHVSHDEPLGTTTLSTHTDLLRSSLIALISIFLLPMMMRLGSEREHRMQGSAWWWNASEKCRLGLGDGREALGWRVREQQALC